MSRFDRMVVLNMITDQGVMSLFHSPEPNDLLSVAEAIASGGGRVLEFTNRVDNAVDVFGRLVDHARRHLPDLIVRVGLVEDAATRGHVRGPLSQARELGLLGVQLRGLRSCDQLRFLMRRQTWDCGHLWKEAFLVATS